MMVDMKKILSIVPFLVAACADTPPSKDGEACVPDKTECESGLCVDSFGDGVKLDGGLCTTTCEWNADGTDDCVDGQTCLRYNPTGEKYCFLDCLTDDDCRTEDGWTCVVLDFLGDKSCIPPL